MNTLSLSHHPMNMAFKFNTFNNLNFNSKKTQYKEFKAESQVFMMKNIEFRMTGKSCLYQMIK